MSDYFAREMLDRLGRDPATVTMDEVIARARQVGFDFKDDAEAFRYLRSEIDELDEAITTGDRAHIEKELGDVELMRREVARRQGIELDPVDAESLRIYLKRYAFIEERLEQQGKRWSDCDYQTELYPLWTESKTAGL